MSCCAIQMSRSHRQPKILVVLAFVFLPIVGCDTQPQDLIPAEQTPPRTAELASSTDPPAAAQLAIGDPAPPLRLSKFVKGEPVSLASGNAIRVVEFWATWCGPCRDGMPHISELQQQHGDDVIFVGVTREDESTVRAFMEQASPSGSTWSDVIQYRIALDEQGITNRNYMQAAGRSGIPCAFIVGRDGVIEWIGHPASIDDPLQQVVDGVWDREAAADALLKEERVTELADQFQRRARVGDWDGALALLDSLEEELGESVAVSMNRLVILEQAGRIDEAAALAAIVVEQSWDDASMLNQMAWKIATAKPQGDLDLALRAAQRAAELVDEQDVSTLDTLARVHYEKGELDQAIQWQQKAADLNQGQYAEVEQQLERYLAEKSSASGQEENAGQDENAGQEENAEPTAENAEPTAENAEPGTENDQAEPDDDGELEAESNAEAETETE